jgi:hypothetical protein
MLKKILIRYKTHKYFKIGCKLDNYFKQKFQASKKFFMAQLNRLLTLTLRRILYAQNNKTHHHSNFSPEFSFPPQNKYFMEGALRGALSTVH